MKDSKRDRESECLLAQNGLTIDVQGTRGLHIKLSYQFLNKFRYLCSYAL